MKICLENADLIVEKYRPLIVSVIESTYFGNDFDDAYDLSVEVVINCIENYDPSISSFGAYLKSYLRYAHLNRANKKDHVAIDLNEEKYEAVLKNDDDIEKDFFNNELRKILFKKMNALSHFQKNILVDYYFNALSLDEMSKKYDRSYQTIANNKSMALKRIKNQFIKENRSYYDLI
ncbi:MAG: sigma-70 family RNA polymerase sigma factor [Tissierellia bacterium]|nr:sigma-70 family RNA polymerase sigma factor [Tissierellia bacterium]